MHAFKNVPAAFSLLDSGSWLLTVPIGACMLKNNLQKPFVWPVVKFCTRNKLNGSNLKNLGSRNAARKWIGPAIASTAILQVALELDASIFVQGTTKPSDFPPIYTTQPFQPYKHRSSWVASMLNTLTTWPKTIFIFCWLLSIIVYCYYNAIVGQLSIATP